MSICQVLEHDHTEIDRLYAEVLDLLIPGKQQAALQGLDLFWARLAVHIRAEHLHLFPAVGGLAEGLAGGAELTATIATLRRDHDLFMRELAGAIKELRTVQNGTVPPASALNQIRARVEDVGDRFAEHNRIEEERIYSLESALSTADAGELLRSISSELAALRPRFNTHY